MHCFMDLLPGPLAVWSLAKVVISELDDVAVLDSHNE